MSIDQADPSWAHFNPVFDASSDGMLLVVPAAALIVAANPALERQFGVPHGRWNGSLFHAVAALQPLAADEAAFRGFAVEVASRPRDAALKSPHGHELYFSVRGTAYTVQDKSYLLLRFRPLVLDTRSSDNLLKSPSLARLVFENAPDGISVRAASHDFSKKRLLACNARYVEMTGFTEAELLAQDDITPHLRSLLTPAEDAAIERRLRDLQPARGLASWVRPDGKENAFEWRAVPMQVGSEVYLLGIDRDITEQRRMEEDLRARQAERDALIGNIPDLVWFKDTHSRYIAVNAAFQKAVGKTLDEMRGKCDFDYSPPDIARKYQADDARVVREKTMLTVEERHELKGKPPSWIVTTKSPILGKDGKVLGTVGIARDITDRRRAELELKQQRARLKTILAQVPSKYLAAHQDDSVVGKIVGKVMAKRKEKEKRARRAGSKRR
ncbi:MAG: PAS domain-containing protein [Planctomycetota bacterium]